MCVMVKELIVHKSLSIALSEVDMTKKILAGKPVLWRRNPKTQRHVKPSVQVSLTRSSSHRTRSRLTSLKCATGNVPNSATQTHVLRRSLIAHKEVATILQTNANRHVWGKRTSLNIRAVKISVGWGWLEKSLTLQMPNTRAINLVKTLAILWMSLVITSALHKWAQWDSLVLTQRHNIDNPAVSSVN